MVGVKGKSGKYIRKPFTEEHKKAIKNTLKGRHISPKTEFQKGHKAWNHEGKGRLKRKSIEFNGKRIQNSHYVFCIFHNLSYIPQEYVIHHKDGNSLNDSIDNLVMMTRKAHLQFHNKLAKERRKK